MSAFHSVFDFGCSFQMADGGFPITTRKAGLTVSGAEISRAGTVRAVCWARTPPTPSVTAAAHINDRKRGLFIDRSSWAEIILALRARVNGDFGPCPVSA